MRQSPACGAAENPQACACWQPVSTGFEATVKRDALTCGGRQRHPSHGTTLLGVSRKGAESLEREIAEAAPEHFDVWLRNGLVEGCGRPEVLGDC